MDNMPMCVLITSVMSNSVETHGLWPTSLLCPWDSPGKNTRVGCLFLLQGIYLTQGSNPGHLHCRQIIYCLSHQGSPIFLDVPGKNICHNSYTFRVIFKNFKEKISSLFSIFRKQNPITTVYNLQTDT